MKYIVVACLILMPSISAHAQRNLADQYDWLYQKLFSQEIRALQPARTSKSFRVHLRDSFRQFPDPQLISKVKLKKPARQTGQITYVGIFPRSYRYDVFEYSSGTRLIQVRVHFGGTENGDAIILEKKFNAAQDLWNQNRAPADFPYSFQFLVVQKAIDAHFSVTLQDSTRGPYDTFWGRNWSSTSIAHELGHMMGLGDEYQTLSGNSDCYEPSLMCNSDYGDPMPHHYYFILRRLI